MIAGKLKKIVQKVIAIRAIGSVIMNGGFPLEELKSIVMAYVLFAEEKNLILDGLIVLNVIMKNLQNGKESMIFLMNNILNTKLDNKLDMPFEWAVLIKNRVKFAEQMKMYMPIMTTILSLLKLDFYADSIMTSIIGVKRKGST